MVGYVTAKDAAEKWNMPVRSIQGLCAAGRIEGAVKFGSVWAIPEETEKPQDGRVISGEYRNWRKKFVKED